MVNSSLTTLGETRSLHDQSCEATEVVDLWIYVDGVIAQFVARIKGYKIEGQTGVTGTYNRNLSHPMSPRWEVLSL
jgi:hypothetical protein